MSITAALAVLLLAGPPPLDRMETQVTTQARDADLTALTLPEAEATFGAPAETDTFPLAPELPEFRTWLPGRATPGEVARRSEVRELTWPLSADRNRTIWFIERGGAWRYLHHMDWDKGAEF